MYETNMWTNNREQKEYLFSYPENYLETQGNALKWSFVGGILPILVACGIIGVVTSSFDTNLVSSSAERRN